MIDPVPSMHRCFMNDLIIYGSVSCIGCPSEARDLPTHASYTNQQTHASMGSPKKSFFSLKEKRIELHGGWYCAWYTNIPSGWYWQFIYDCIIYISYYLFSWWNHHLSGIRELFFKKIRIVYQHMNYIGWRYIFLMVNLKVILWFWTIWIYKKLMIKY